MSASVTIKRPTGVKWRQKMYAALVARDGDACSQCGVAAVTIWRRMGTWGSRDGGRHTMVHPTSNLEVDHRIALSAAGDNALSNLWLLCVDCHKVKTAAERSARSKQPRVLASLQA